MLPAVFVGVWIRESIAVGDAEAAETDDVVWIQGFETFADVRLPRRPGTSGIQAFGGTTRWDGKVLRWDHELDWHGAFADTDHGRIEWIDDVMVERGTMSVTGHDGGRRELPYEEIWRREAVAGTVLAMGGASPRGVSLHVAVTGWAITLATCGPGTFATRVVRPDGRTVEEGDGGLCAPEIDDPSWGWIERDVPAPSVPEMQP